MKDAVPVEELIKLRDWFYESDGITMNNLGRLNALIKKYSSKEIPKIETGFERWALEDGKKALADKYNKGL